MRPPIWFALMAAALLVACATVPDKMPELVTRTQPMYPIEALQENKPGTAMVSFIVEKDGTVSNAEVLSATRRDFGLSAAACVRKWTFQPGIKDGKRVRTRMQQSFSFEPSAQ